MTNEEAIAVLKESKRQNEIMRDNPTTFWKSSDMEAGVENTKKRIEALDAAISVFCSTDHFGEVTKTAPLTLKRLRKKIDEPVYVQNIDGKFRDSWQILKDVNDEEIVFYGKSLCGYRPTKELGKTYNLYSYPPARIDREKWTAEWVKYDGYTECSKCEYWYNSSENEDEGDRPAFCPSCGRAMTQGAMEVLESRFNG